MSAPKKPETELAQPTVQGPGANLRAAREARGVSIDKIADQLHLSRSAVEAIEEDDYQSLPGSVFVRGYLKNYARLMELPIGQVLDRYEKSRPNEQIATPVVKGNIKDEVDGGHAGMRLVTWTIVVLLLALVFSWWKGYLDWPPTMSARSPAAMSEPNAPGQIPVVPDFSPLSTPELEVSAEPEESAAVAPEPVEVVELPPEPAVPETGPIADREGAEVIQPKAQPEPSSTAQVVFGFSGPCWVNVRDSSGQRRLFGEMAAGDRKPVEGTPPWSVVLGNSRAVRITINGEPFDHSRYASGNVARFTLSLDER